MITETVTGTCRCGRFVTPHPGPASNASSTPGHAHANRSATGRPATPSPAAAAIASDSAPVKARRNGGKRARKPAEGRPDQPPHPADDPGEAVKHGGQPNAPAGDVLKFIAASGPAGETRAAVEHLGTGAGRQLDALVKAGKVAHVKGRRYAVLSVTEEGDDGEDVLIAGRAGISPPPRPGPAAPPHGLGGKDGLPVSFVGAAGEVAIAGAAGVGSARLVLGGERIVLPVLWEALIADSGAGKNPAIDRALIGQLVTTGCWPSGWAPRASPRRGVARPAALCQTSVTVESLARWLAKSGGSGIIRNGELASFLRGLGQYKGGGGSDRFDLMDIWSGMEIHIERVGDGGKKNAIEIHVPHPRFSIIGGLVPDNVKLLGPESDGMRARFLPNLPSSDVVPNFGGSKPLPETWRKAADALYERPEPRDWHLRGDAQAAAKAAVADWKERERHAAEPVVVKTFLRKADEHCLRIALTAAESEAPGKGGDIPRWAVDYAIARVDYFAGCWLAIGS